MNIKRKIKNVAVEVNKKRVFNKVRRKEIKRIEKQIAESAEIIPNLTKEQERKILEFWSRYEISVPLQWYRFFLGKTGYIKPEFIPEPVFHQEVKPYMNNHVFAGVWSDKAYMDYFIRDVKTPRSIVRNVNGRFLDENFNLISVEEVVKVINQFESLVIKPSTYTDTGKGVQLLEFPFDLEKICDQYKKNFVIQIPLSQNAEIAKLNSSSINTIRVNSVLLGTEAHVMSAFIKVGQMGEFADNHGKNRYFIGIKEDGTYNNYAINHDLHKFQTIPSGYDFANKKVPCYKKVCEAVKKAHKCIPHFGFAFWDVCVNQEDEPVIVEVNLRYPDTTIPQVAQGPFLGKYTEEIMNYIDKYK